MISLSLSLFFLFLPVSRIERVEIRTCYMTSRIATHWLFMRLVDAVKSPMTIVACIIPLSGKATNHFNRRNCCDGQRMTERQAVYIDAATKIKPPSLLQKKNVSNHADETDYSHYLCVAYFCIKHMFVHVSIANAIILAFSGILVSESTFRRRNMSKFICTWFSAQGLRATDWLRLCNTSIR